MPSLRHALPLAAALALAACASGPRLADVQANLPPLKPDQGRVWLYRTAVLGAAVQPAIYLDRQAIGACVPNGVSYADVAPGDHQASASTEAEHTLSFSLAPAEEKFIRCYIGIGFFVGQPHLELVDPEEARREIADLHYTGK